MNALLSVLTLWLICGGVSVLLMRWNSRHWSKGEQRIMFVLGPAGWLVALLCAGIGFLLCVAGNRGAFQDGKGVDR